MLHDMVDTMYIANGIGLAAPQIGVLERVIVVDIDPDNRGKNLLKIINPGHRRVRTARSSGKKAASASSTTPPR